MKKLSVTLPLVGAAIAGMLSMSQPAVAHGPSNGHSNFGSAVQDLFDGRLIVTTHRHHRRHRHLSVNQMARRLERAGYYHARFRKCENHVCFFRATRGRGQRVALRVNPHNAAVLSVRRLALSIQQMTRRINRAGYHNIRHRRCEGRACYFRAQGNRGGLFRVSINKFNGHIFDVDRIRRRLSVNQMANRIDRAGFYNVRFRRCEGRTCIFRASGRRGFPVRVEVNQFNGNILSVNPIHRRRHST